jgi:predicted enzyme related to lactoylglutathione lyase
VSDSTSSSQISLIHQDAGVAGRDFAALLGVEPDHVEAGFAQVTVGGFCVSFSPTAPVPMAPSAGVILHIEVPDLEAEHARLREAGATILLEPTDTERGTRELYIEAPGAVVGLFTRI